MAREKSAKTAAQLDTEIAIELARTWKPTVDDIEIMRVVRDRLMEIATPAEQNEIYYAASRGGDPNRLEIMYADSLAKARLRVALRYVDDPAIASLLKLTSYTGAKLGRR